MTPPTWLAVEVIATERLVLEPLRIGHADELAPLLDDESLHEHIGGRPASGAHQRRGYAGEAAAAMARWLRIHGVEVLVAHVHPGHHASMGVARRVGLTPSDLIVNGETRWTS